METVVIIAPKADDAIPGAGKLGADSLASGRAATSDTARLLQDVPGLSVYGAGGISSLPAIHGLADDRVRTQVDGMDLMPACPNHMNSVLSYINPTRVGEITVYAGITPVSVGGDSIGGTVQVRSAPPEFARPGAAAVVTGQLGGFYRSNGNAKGYNLGATLASDVANLSVSESKSQSDNYRAGKDFKLPTSGREGGPLIPGNVVGSTAYADSENRDIGLALRHEGHLLQLNVGEQTVGFEGFPNQRMDMTANKNTLINLLYTGQYQWGILEVRVYNQDTRHKMDMGPDRHTYGTGMPMDTKAKTRGGLLQGNIEVTERDFVRLGGEYQQYTLYDWWPPVGGSMGPDAFWNVDYGQRNKLDFFAEWEARWIPGWMSLLGLRSDTVKTDAAMVQGYDDTLRGLWGNDADAFNARDRARTDHNWDLTALMRYVPDARQNYEAGYARKSRAPNLYQRYPWSTQPMAALMNNFVGDGNGYIGDVNLRPEVAHTLSASGNWHSGESLPWDAKATGYYTYVQDYVDARRCDFGQCNTTNATTTTGFVLLQYANQSARLYGIDLSGQVTLAQSTDYGSFSGTALVNYVRGENRRTGDNLYNIMPPNAKLAISQRIGAWTNTAELQMVGAKQHVSQVRNEIRTPGYSLCNLRSSYVWKHVRLDLAIENLFNRYYSMPLGGAYVGQGASMTSNGIPWGPAIPGMGRSINVALNAHF